MPTVWISGLFFYSLECEEVAVRMTRMLRTIFLKSLLVFALLFAQQGAFAHGIAHTLAEQSQEQSLPHDKHCDLCAVYAQIGSAIGISHIHFDFASSFEASTRHSFRFFPFHRVHRLRGTRSALLRIKSFRFPVLNARDFVFALLE